MTLILGAVAATLALLGVAAILIGTAEGRPTLNRTRRGAEWACWSLIAAVLSLGSGMHRGAGNGFRWLAGRIRAIRQAPQPDAAPERKPAPGPGRHRKVVTAR